jgi:hypothetical protein
MIRLKFNIKAHKSWPVINRNLVKKATDWGVKRLDIDKQAVTVLFRFMGASLGSDRGDCIKLTDNKFVIHIYADKSLRRTISTLFHELTHVKQHIYDGFTLTNTSAIWKSDYLHLSEEDYWDSPWEVEARQYERKLRKEFFDLTKNNS